jgi:hypothetical protein
MPRSRKINLAKVRASLDAVCPKCGKVIPPAEVRRIDFERIECRCAERDLCLARKGESRRVVAKTAQPGQDWAGFLTLVG